MSAYIFELHLDRELLVWIHVDEINYFYVIIVLAVIFRRRRHGTIEEAMVIYVTIIRDFTKVRPWNLPRLLANLESCTLDLEPWLALL